MMSDAEAVGRVPNKRVGMRAVEPLLRQFLAYQLANISDTIDHPEAFLVAELFEGYGDDVVTSIKDWFREHKRVEVSLNYPRHDLALPFVSVVNGYEREKEGGQLLDDYGGQSVVIDTNTDGTLRSTSRRLMSIPQVHQTQIFIGADDPNVALYLAVVLRALIYTNKTAFNKSCDMHSLVVSSQDLQFRPELFPTFAYFKVIVLDYETSFDVASLESCTIGGVDVSLETSFGDTND